MRNTFQNQFKSKRKSRRAAWIRAAERLTDARVYSAYLDPGVIEFLTEGARPLRKGETGTTFVPYVSKG